MNRVGIKLRIPNPYCLVLLAFTSLGLTACTEVIDLDTGRPRQQLVIFGRVTDGLAGNEVRVSLTSVEGLEPEPVDNAQVWLIEDGEILAEYTERSPGFYRLNLPQDSARTGRVYHIRVRAPGGSVYESTPTVMPAQVAIDSLYFEQGRLEEVVNEAGITVERRLANFKVDSEIVNPGQDFFLKWHLIEAYGFQERIRVTPIPRVPCFITNEISGQQVRLFNGAKLRVPRIIGQPMSRVVIDRKFAFDYYFSVIQTTIDRDTHLYYERLNAVSSTQGSIFDQPPAPLPGNITNIDDPEEEVLGYFEVVRADTSRIRVRNTDLEFRVLLPCPQANFRIEGPECTECLVLTNSSLQRPYYWF